MHASVPAGMYGAILIVYLLSPHHGGQLFLYMATSALASGGPLERLCTCVENKVSMPNLLG